MKKNYVVYETKHIEETNKYGVSTLGLGLAEYKKVATCSCHEEANDFIKYERKDKHLYKIVAKNKGETK